MHRLFIDLETYSSVDLTKSGVYRYTEAPDFQVLLFGYAIDDEPVQVIDLASGEEIPKDIMYMLYDPEVLKIAHNALFERVCLNRYLKRAVLDQQWYCTMVHAYYLGLPGQLEEVARVLNLNQQKMAAGKALIRYFCVPQSVKNQDGLWVHGQRNLPQDAPDKWQMFKAYNAQDVETERELYKVLNRHPLPEREHKLWVLDQFINDYGVKVDLPMVRHAIICANNHQARLEKEAISLTGLSNPNSTAQLKSWLQETEGIEIESLNKKALPAIMKQLSEDTTRRVLEIRRELAKTSIKKYEAIDRTVCSDGRVRGLFQFYGARTGRWAGRLVQVQNLPQNKIKDLGLARELLETGDYESLEMLFGSVPDILSQLLRTAFIANEGRRFIVADFSSIEARVLSWLAQENWRIEVFKSHGKIYEASAAQMFKVPIETITKDNPLRQKGKIAELALGYGGSVGALKSMGALEMGLTEDELPGLVKTWRAANPKIVEFWWDVEEAAISAIEGKPAVLQYGLKFYYKNGALIIHLPSGRELFYQNPVIEPDKTGRQVITFDGQEQGKWTRVKTRGPKLVENIIQAVSRDCLAEAMLRLDEEGYVIVMHVHDEVILEMPNNWGSVDEVCEIMRQPLSWAPGLPLNADGYETTFYKKE